MTGDARDLARDPGTLAALDRLYATRPGTPKLPLEHIALERVRADEEAAATLEQGWLRPPHPRVTLAVPVAWDEICAENRSWTYHLHAWEPMSVVLAEHSRTGERRFFDYCLALALDWAAQYPDHDPASPFAWYDMALGMRAFRAAYLIDSAVRLDDVAPEDVAALLGTLRLHLRVLADDAGFRAHSNHGIYQAAGQLAAARRLPELPEATAAAVQASLRLHRLIEHHFGPDGVHREHSPGYHLMVLRTLLRMRSAGLIDRADDVERLDRAQEAMAWFVAPVGTVPTVGDSDRRLSDTAPDPHVTSPVLEFALTKGARGEPPATTFRAFPDGGYVSARDAWAAGDAFSRGSYLLQTCAFHSRVHKHADDLSFVWYAHGHDLLTDAGRYGYIGRTAPDSELAREGFYYSDPTRVYVESTRAHNCLEIDGRSYRRRGAKAYGSALLSASHDPETGLVATEASVAHFGTIRHTRLLFHLPAQWVLLVDHVADQDQDGRHDYVQRLLFGPALEDLAPLADGVRLRVPGSGDALVAISLDEAEPVEPVRGRREPELAGFVSQRPSELLPAWTAGFRRAGVQRATFVTLLALVPAGGSSAVAGSARVNATARRGQVQWTVGGGGERRLSWDRHEAPLRAAFQQDGP
jgi:hypothetical protein